MAMAVVLKYLKEVGQGRWEYRRRVPESVKLIVGKTEWKRVFSARSEPEMLRQYGRVDAEFLREVKAAKAQTAHERATSTPRNAWLAALREAEELLEGVTGADEIGDDPDALGFIPEHARDVLAESLLRSGKSDPVLLNAILHPTQDPPAHNLQDECNLYIKEKLGGGEGAQNREPMLRLAKVMKRAEEAGLPPSTEMVNLEREHARKVRDYMLNVEKKGGGMVAPGSVKRDLALLKSVISYGIRELGLSGKAHNPFEKLPIEGTETVQARIADREKVDSLPSKVLSAMRGKLTGELLLIWRLLDGTGCRLAEITGLRVSDVVITGDIPHVKLRWHEGRRLKNLSSVRSVPLAGDAFGAAQEALRQAGSSVYLFPRYARVRGPDAASAALMKHLRGFTADKRHKVHSLRHGMKDKMRLAGVDKIAQDIVLGHAAPNVGEIYGGEQGLLAVAHRALAAVADFEAQSRRGVQSA